METLVPAKYVSKVQLGPQLASDGWVIIQVLKWMMQLKILFSSRSIEKRAPSIMYIVHASGAKQKYDSQSINHQRPPTIKQKYDSQSINHQRPPTINGSAGLLGCG